MAAGAPAVPGPTGHQITDVDGEGRGLVGGVDPAGPAVGRVHVDLQAALSVLPVEQRHRTEVGVRADAELTRLRLADDVHTRVPVDVQGVRGMRGVPGEEVLGLAEGGRQQPQHLVRHFAHRRQVPLHDLPQGGDLRVGPDVRLEPERVRRRVAARPVRPHRPGLLEIRGSGGPLGVAIGLRPPAEPAPAAHAHRVPLLGPGRQREELPGDAPHHRAGLAAHPVPGDQQEARPGERGVHRGGGRGPRGAVPRQPRAQIDHRDIRRLRHARSFRSEGPVGIRTGRSPAGSHPGPGARRPGPGPTPRCPRTTARAVPR